MCSPSINALTMSDVELLDGNNIIYVSSDRMNVWYNVNHKHINYIVQIKCKFLICQTGLYHFILDVTKWIKEEKSRKDNQQAIG